MADLLPQLKQRFYDSNGDPLAGGKLYSYEAGTTTPKATYTTSAGDVANANPIILDANGECNVYINAENYKFVLKDSSDVTQWTVDNATLPSVSALASAFYRRQTNLTSADSPYTMDSDDNGTLFNVNSSGGAVVINAPEISSVDLPFNFAVILETAGNNCTINRAGTDTLAGATSKVISAAGVGAQFIADDQTAPDKWSYLEFGTVSDGSITHAKLNAAVISGGTEDLTPDQDSDYILTYDDSAAANKKVKLARARDLVVQSKSATYTALVTDDVIVCSGASWTLTLPTAVGYSGKVFEILHNGTSLTQVYTIDGNGAETIGGSTTYALYTSSEKLKIVSDGSNWLVLEHRAETDWVDAGAMTITATTANPTKGTMSLDKVYWKRDGRNAQFIYQYRQTTNGANGTGVYLFALPSNMSFDTAIVPANAVTSGTDHETKGFMGEFSGHVPGALISNGTCHVYDSSKFYNIVIDATSGAPQSATLYQLAGNVNLQFSMRITAPISGWNP